MAEFERSVPPSKTRENIEEPIFEFTMAVTYRKRSKRGVSRKSVKSRRPTRVKRAFGAFGLYRNTKWAPLRAMARRGGLHAPRVPRTFGSLFPNAGKLMRHKYCDRVRIPAQTTAGLNTVYVIRANSLYDPDYTGVGHQPMFHDEMAEHYQKYTVMWSTLKLVIPNGDDKQRIWGIQLCDDPGEILSTSSFTNTMEQYSHMNVCRTDKRPAPLVLTKKFSAPTEFKTTYTGILADDTQAVTKDTNPPAAVARYFVIWCAPLTASDTLTELPVTIEMVFSAQWRYSIPATGS